VRWWSRGATLENGFFLKKRDETSENEDPLAAANDFLPLLQLEQHKHKNDEEFQTNEPIIFRGIEYLQRDPGLFQFAYHSSSFYGKR
jgi:hypothetical protein